MKPKKIFPGSIYRILFTITFTLLLLVVAANVLFYVTEDQRFRGTARPADYAYQFKVPFTEINLAGREGGKIHAILFPASSSKGVVFFFPGTQSNVEYAFSLTRHFLDMGYDLFIIEYRGCGKSTGPSREELFYDDAMLMYRELTKKYREDQVILVGHSFGAAIAANIASFTKPAGLLLIAPLYSINEKYRMRRPWHYRKYKFETYKYVEQATCPVYLACGTKDELYKQTIQLLHHVKIPDALITVQGEDHISIFHAAFFYQTVSSLFNNKLIFRSYK